MQTGSDETNTCTSFTNEHRSLGLVHRRPNRDVNVLRAPRSRDSGVPSTEYGVNRLNSLVKNVVENDSVYMNPSVPSNCIHDSGQERQDSLQYPLSQNNINVPLAEGQTVSWDQNDDETEVPEFIGLATKVNNTILLQKIFISLMTKSGTVEDFNILLDSGRNRSFILNLALDKLEAKHIAVEKLIFGSSNVK